jgi:diguanylate cyclase (GGDEF)-like protein/hemerythrin-like metal-binding protein/PAS domain S-box-containing protein
LAVLDLTGRLREANAAFCETTGYALEELLLPTFELGQLSLPEEAGGHTESVAILCRGEEESYRKPRQVVCKGGGVVWVEWVVKLLRDAEGAPQSLVLTAIDITEQKRIEDALRHMSFYDPLTKLANRRLLQDRLQTELARARREERGVALLFIDLDKFKPINDTLGHEAGDWLLKSAARRMTDCLRAYDTAARFGGDEFVVLLPDLACLADALRVAERMLASLAQPFTTDDGQRMEISASIGLSLFPEHAETECDLLHAGDEAMYEAKKSGRNRIVSAARMASRNPSPDAPEEVATGPVHLRWESHCASGNVFIDGEHRELFRQSNQLIDLVMRTDARPDAVYASMLRLMGAVSAHFKHEEKLLGQWKFPGLAEHMQKHGRLLEHAERIAQVLHDQSIPTGELLGFLVGEMIHGHLITEDNNYFYLLGHNSPG